MENDIDTSLLRKSRAERRRIERSKEKFTGTTLDKSTDKITVSKAELTRIIDEEVKKKTDTYKENQNAQLIIEANAFLDKRKEEIFTFAYIKTLYIVLYTLNKSFGFGKDRLLKFINMYLTHSELDAVDIKEFIDEKIDAELM